MIKNPYVTIVPSCYIYTFDLKCRQFPNQELPIAEYKAVNFYKWT